MSEQKNQNSLSGGIDCRFELVNYLGNLPDLCKLFIFKQTPPYKQTLHI